MAIFDDEADNLTPDEKARLRKIRAETPAKTGQGQDGKNPSKLAKPDGKNKDDR